MVAIDNNKTADNLFGINDKEIIQVLYVGFEKQEKALWKRLSIKIPRQPGITYWLS